MKVVSLLFIIVLLCFSSCKKTENNPSSESDLHSLTLTLNGFGQIITDTKNGGFISSDPVPLKDYVHFLNYFIYGQDGNLVHSLKQADTDANFGKITDQVPAGTYSVVLVGSRYNNTFGGTTALSTSKTLSAAVDDDLFFKKVSITVGSDDLSQSVVLDRVSSYMEVSIEESLPAEVASIDVTVQNEADVFMFASESVQIGTVPATKKFTKVISSDDDRNNPRMGMCILNVVSDLSVQIYCYDSAKKYIKGVKVQNVKCEKNRKTILYGKVFAMPSGEFPVSVNPEWGDPIAKPF
ncbi:fimbrillin-A associated anchor protein Mfa1/Mfa2 [Arcticibacter tournemirensis]|uniref:FimB/Mfa2 family fimbrial subunit n=1 Tax=Arcticibacter tournemirensis TaxID=699437 RepID=A0A5M9H6Y0_9SPHI|nr:FimB/Mfa2 family fimbrial subunit [Arcticibacter tournemirensis]KAA8482049.1 FimB/Mfa2 family fimbrial subunit [Arcticibacter tournemirensis]TQM49461.1 fimbrillin-A associated anchor protein Mfa1/Mfa2 [Arcticibacter tournemirensis]